MIEFDVEGCGTIFSEKIGTCKLDIFTSPYSLPPIPPSLTLIPLSTFDGYLYINTIAYGKTEKNWLPIMPAGSDRLNPAEAAESIRGELLIEIERYYFSPLSPPFLLPPYHLTFTAYCSVSGRFLYARTSFLPSNGEATRRTVQFTTTLVSPLYLPLSSFPLFSPFHSLFSFVPFFF